LVVSGTPFELVLALHWYSTDRRFLFLFCVPSLVISPSRLPPAFSSFVLYLSFMDTITTIHRTTKRGLHSVWHFVECTDGYYAFGGCHVPLIKRFDTVDELRELYRSYIGYGYTQMVSMSQLELPVSA